MADLYAKIAQAKKAGYSDGEIASFLGQDSSFAPKIAEAKKAGYDDASIISFLSQTPTAKPPTRKVDADAAERVSNTPNALRAFSTGLSWGAAGDLDALGAGLETGIGNTVKRALGKPVDYSAGEARTAVKRANVLADAAYTKEHPLASTAINVAGAIAAPGGGLAGKVIAKGATAGARTLRAAGVGAVGGGLYGALTAPEGERLKGGATGAALGGVAGGATQGVLNALGPKAAIDNAQRRLSREGVDLTPGQMAGGIGKRLEDVATSIPITGAAINKARTRGLESLNIAAANRALAPIGDAIDRTTTAGHAALTEATQKISNAYDAALTPVKVSPDQPFVQAVQGVLSRPNLPAAVKADLTSIINDATSRFKPGTSGRDWKNLDAELGAMIRSADNASAQNPVQRFMKDALTDVQRAFRETLDRQAPQAAAAVAKADEATANLVRLRDAAQRIGADTEGVATPAQLRSAARANDTSAGNRKFATGNALMQDLANDAVEVLPSKIPDSGTALRGMIGLGAYGGAAGAVGPQNALAAFAADAAASTIYSKPVQQVLNKIYRATDRQAATQGVTLLRDMAKKNPKLQPLIAELEARLRLAPAEAAARAKPGGVSIEAGGTTYPDRPRVVDWSTGRPG